MLNYDLHTHSTYSDGKGSLHDNIHAAEAMGLSHIALTDHLRVDERDWVDEALEELKDDYYRAMGWDLSTGNPTHTVLDHLEIVR